MSDKAGSKCPQCGATLTEGAPAGLCPNCLMALNFKTESVFTGTVAAQPPLPPEEIARHFPQLEILECLGRGGMGVVYRARQKSLNRIVALKLLAPERADDPRFAERFSREAHALAALNHPNIVTVYDFGQAGGFYFLLMELVDGVNLRQLMRTRRLSPEEALTIVPPLCDALQFAHERGIVHRDIKPENVLLGKTGRVRIADFGIAKMLDADDSGASQTVSPENATQGALGTPGYSAPEQKNWPHRVDSRADIYSLGVVFYEMLTGELPGKSIEPPSKKVQIDVRLDEVVLRALEQKPEQRYQTAGVLKTDVETIANTQKQFEKHSYQPQSFFDRLDRKDIENALIGCCGFAGLLGWWLAKAYDEKLFYLFFLFFFAFAFWIPVLFHLFVRPRMPFPTKGGIPSEEQSSPPQSDCSKAAKAKSRPRVTIARGVGLPITGFALCYACFVGYLAYSAQLLPERVACHFGLNLQADDWMPQQKFLFIIGSVPLIFPFLFLAVLAIMRVAGVSVRIAINTFRNGLWFSCLFTAFVGGIQYLNVQANRIEPPRLPTGSFIVLILVFLLATGSFAVRAASRSSVWAKPD